MKKDKNVKNRAYHIYGIMKQKLEEEQHEIIHEDSSLCEEWESIENFEKWYNEYIADMNKEYEFCYVLDNYILQRDKENNFLYSPETCCIVPVQIRNVVRYEILYKMNPNFNKETPIGVYYNRLRDKYNVVSLFRTMDLFDYSTPEQAFEAFKYKKEKEIKELAEEYYAIGALHKEIYDTLMKWEVINTHG